MHNDFIEDSIRKENSLFNEVWISRNNLIGFDAISSECLGADLKGQSDANAFMVVWLKNVDRLIEIFCKYFKASNYVLCDVGCGSGISTLYFYEKQLFKRCWGFDISPALVEMANVNKEIFKRNQSLSLDLRFDVGNALDILLPDEKLALFMFNPFSENVLRAFIERNISILRKNKCIVLYANDLHLTSLMRFGRTLQRDNVFNLSVFEFV